MLFECAKLFPQFYKSMLCYLNFYNNSYYFWPGLQYGSTNNPLLAEKFFKEAISLAPEDPFVLAEMGALNLQIGKWEYALSFLQQVKFKSVKLLRIDLKT